MSSSCFCLFLLLFSTAAASPSCGDDLSCSGGRQYTPAEELRKEGVRLFDSGLTAEAVAVYAELINRPAVAVVEDHTRLAALFSRAGQPQEAYKVLQQAVATPTFADSFQLHDALGIIADGLDDVDGAAAHFRRAIELQPGGPVAYNNLGLLYFKRKMFAEANKYLTRAHELNRSDGRTFFNLLISRSETSNWEDSEYMHATMRGFVDRHDFSLPPFQALRFNLTVEQIHHICAARADWVLASVAGLLPKRSFIPAGLSAGAVDDRAYLIDERRTSGRPRYPIRVGYLSGDLTANHPVGIAMQAVLELHDEERFNVTCYALSMPSEHFRRLCSHGGREQLLLVSSSPSFLLLAEAVHADGIDILVDLHGYTAQAKTELFALRASPVQINFLGFANTMAAPFIDHIITDAVIHHHLLSYSNSTSPFEKPLFHPIAYLPSSNPLRHPAVPFQPLPKRPDELAGSRFVFACFNQLYKIDAEIFAVWAKILRRVPGSVLWLKSRVDYAHANINAHAAAANLTGRVILTQNFTSREEYFTQIMAADLFLDTPAYNGHTTVADALWAGVPVLTMPGQTMASRVAASLLRAGGLETDLVVHSLQAYEDRAVELALRPFTYRRLRQQVEAGRLQPVPLWDTREYVRQLEKLFEQAFDEAIPR